MARVPQGKHRMDFSDRCIDCGVRHTEIEDGLASPWCDYFQPSSGNTLGLLIHALAILIFVAGPLISALVAQGAGYGLLAIIGVFSALIIAEIHAGRLDWLILG